MNLIAPIMMFAVALGLFRPRMGKGEWIALSLWIVAVVIRYYIKGPV
jgi:EamA domain-containing membrane protein RarD